MSLIGLLFYIAIFVIIINAKKQEKVNQGKPQDKTRHNTERTLGQGMFLGNENKTAVPNISREAKQVVPNRMPPKPAVPNVPRKKERKNVVLEPHREELVQPRIRNNNLWGEDKFANQRIVALRLMEGDPVPQGYTVVKCPYCAAENLVTKNCKQHHSCYFCRVPID